LKNFYFKLETYALLCFPVCLGEQLRQKSREREGERGRGGMGWGWVESRNTFAWLQTRKWCVSNANGGQRKSRTKAND